MPANKLKLYNTLSRKVETFTPFNAGEVKIYTCGPTVYSQPHIGNFAAYIYWDLLIRTLKAQGYGVKRVLNLTDVGHLTSDADDGEDKLEKGARLTGKTVWEVAEFYIDKFLADYSALDLTPPDLLARATDYIPEDIELVDILTAKGYTYETRDGIYYNTAKFPHYADFARLDLDNLKAGARVEFSDEKLNPSDFAVWKFIQPGEKHEMRWDYLGRPGYPGWHLECSTIIHTELGETIDIHAGGIDHIPTHHTNEIAQSEAAFEKKLAKYWIHCNHLTSEGQKISKSLGNGYSLADLAEKGYSPLDFKMWVLQGHYQSERDFSLENLEAARIRRLNWRNRIAKCYQTPASSSTTTPDAIADIIDALDDNLNSPKAFAIIDAVTNDNLDFWQQIDHLFGLGLLSDSPELGSAAKKLLVSRQAARAAKDFATSDRLRDELLAQNISVLDSKDGQIWQYAR
jgi:cysteinyl-tRNA synthetase